MKYFNLISFLFTNLAINSQNYIVDGYTDKQSYRAGENVIFFTKSHSNNPILPSVPLLKRGSNNAVGAISGFNPNTQPSQNFLSGYIDGFNYQSTNIWGVPSLNTLPSFVYYLDLPNPIPIVIKGDKNNLDVVVVFATNTENMYCQAGGAGGYPQPNFSPTVSFNRPIGINENSANQFDLGFFQWIQAGNRFGNYKVGFISDADMEDYSEIANAKLLVIIGHSEYWTRDMRKNLDKFIDNGKDVLILSGNTMWWQARLQNDPNNTNNPQIVCSKYGESYGAIDSICDPLLKTWHWEEQNLKYSTQSSIGSDWGVGGFSGCRACNIADLQNYPPQGYGKHKVILTNSPIFNGVTLPIEQNLGPVIDFYKNANAEIDGILIKRDVAGNVIYDNNNNPILDIEAMGYYKAEMVTYDKATYRQSNNPPFDVFPKLLPYPQPLFFTGVIVMQKKCNSGRMINVNCDEWCNPEILGTISLIQDVSQNMIDLLLSGSNIFADSSPPQQFKITSAFNNVSYEACANGIINISPCGVTISDGYKVDATGAPAFSAKLINCTSCNRGAKSVIEENEKQDSKKELRKTNNYEYAVYPLPANDLLTVDVDLNQDLNLLVSIESLLGEKIFIADKNLKNGRNTFYIQTKDLIEGVYILRISNAQNLNLITSKRILILH